MPGKIDEQRRFIPVNIAVLTVSDSRTLDTDTSGAALVECLEAAGHRLAARTILPDDADRLEAQFRSWIDDDDIDVVISTGGTGVTGRDVTVEALKRVIDKDIPGFGELFRWLSYQKIGTSTIQSRAMAGVAGGTYLFALPGSTGRVPRCLGRHPEDPARLSFSAVQLRRAHAPAEGTPLPGLTPHQTTTRAENGR